MRSNLQDTRSTKGNIVSTYFGVERKAISADYTIEADSPFLIFLDPGASNRNVTLPPFKRGAAHAIIHYGAASNLVVKDTDANTIATLSNIQGALFVCSGNEWKYLTNTFSDALDTSEISSPDLSITVTVVGGTALEIVVNEAAVDHDALLNFVANEHIDHTAVTFSTAANSGLAGGGTIAANRALSLDVNNLATIVPVLADLFPFYDSSGLVTGKAALSALNAILIHDDLVGFVANEHIDHSTVSVTAGAGLSGGGTIDATRTISLDITGQSNAALVGTDEFIYWSVLGADFDKRTFGEMITDLSLLTTSAAATAYQPLDAFLTSIATLGTAADKFLYTTAANTAAESDITAFSRTLLDDASAATALATLTARGQGKETIWIPATAMISATTNGPAITVVEQTTNKNMTKTLDFDQTTSESAQFMVAFPKSWNLGTVTFIPHWTAASGAGTVIWALGGVAISNDDTLDVAFGTGQSSTDTLIAAYDNHVGPESNPITIAGTPAALDLINFRLQRDASDTLNADAKLIGVQIIFTTNAVNDA